MNCNREHNSASIVITEFNGIHRQQGGCNPSRLAVSIDFSLAFSLDSTSHYLAFAGYSWTRLDLRLPSYNSVGLSILRVDLASSRTNPAPLRLLQQASTAWLKKDFVPSQRRVSVLKSGMKQMCRFNSRLIGGGS